MSQRYVTLPNGRQCGLAKYREAWLKLLKLPPDAPITGFGHFALTAREVLGALREGLDDRINRQIPGYGRGRKWEYGWQKDAAQTARAVNTPRLIVRWCPRDLKARLAHRLEAA